MYGLDGADGFMKNTQMVIVVGGQPGVRNIIMLEIAPGRTRLSAFAAMPKKDLLHAEFFYPQQVLEMTRVGLAVEDRW
jgi:hypothetical protein